jgi:hypothetical protein
VSTLGELEAQGFDGLEIQCRCQRFVCYPFPLLYERGLRRDYELEIVAARFLCKTCHRLASPDQVTGYRIGHLVPEMPIRVTGCTTLNQPEDQRDSASRGCGDDGKLTLTSAKRSPTK